MTAFLIGGDCGGTKSTFVTLTVDNGKLRKKMTLGPANVIADPVNSLTVIKAGVTRLLAEEQDNCVGIVLGVAGLTTAGIQEQLQREFAFFAGPVWLLDDAQLALYGKLMGRDGALLIAGTGSIAYARYQGVFTRAGGFGHLLGDEGSGYWIGREAFLRVCKACDDPKVTDELTKEMLANEGTTDPMMVVRHFYQMTKSDVAAYSAFVAASKTAAAQEILLAAAEKLVELALTLKCKAQLPTGLPLAFSGSILLQNQLVQETIRQRLAEDFKVLPVVNEEISLLQGTYHYFWEQQV